VIVKVMRDGELWYQLVIPPVRSRSPELNGLALGIAAPGSYVTVDVQNDSDPTDLTLVLE
jgi:hypothetical protein